MIFQGWFFVTLTYVITLVLSATVGALLKPDNDPAFFQNFVGGFLIIVPYVIAGIFVSGKFSNPSKSALLISIVPVLGERLIIFLIGTYYVSERFLPGWNMYTVMMFIQAKTPAFYFTVPYIILGFISILITIVVANLKKKNV